MELQSLNAHYTHGDISVYISTGVIGGQLNVSASKTLSPGRKDTLALTYDNNGHCTVDGVVPAAPFDEDFYAALEAQIAAFNLMRTPAPAEEA